MIGVELTDDTDPYQFTVTVTEGESESRHRVTMAHATHRELTGGGATPEETVEAAFRFLLEREPKEMVLSSFDITVISKYFPSFADDISEYF